MNRLQDSVTLEEFLWLCRNFKKELRLGAAFNVWHIYRYLNAQILDEYNANQVEMVFPISFAQTMLVERKTPNSCLNIVKLEAKSQLLPLFLVKKLTSYDNCTVFLIIRSS